MFPALKTLLPLAVLALVLGGAFALQPAPAVRADLSGTDIDDDGVWFLRNYNPGGTSECEDGNLREVRLFGSDDLVTKIARLQDATGPLPVIQIPVDSDLIMCVEPQSDSLPLVFNTSGGGEWNNARCGTFADTCDEELGVGSSSLSIPGDVNDLIPTAVTFSCNGPSVQTIRILQDDANAGEGDEIRFRIMCKGDAANIQISAIPGTVESHPALYNTSHALIRAVITDSAGNPILPDSVAEVTSTCGISVEAVDTLDERNEALFDAGEDTHDGLDMDDINAEFGDPPLPNYLDIIEFSDRDTDTIALSLEANPMEVDTNAYPDVADPSEDGDGVPNHSEVLVIFHAEGCQPGPHSVTIEVDGEEATVDITVIGPPAFITVTAAPTELTCGEKSEITVSVTDALNQPVSDNTWVEVVTNYGGVLAGTGSSLFSGQPVNPLSSTTVEIFDGLGIAYLLTSDEHVGPYEVLAASIPSHLGTGLLESVPVTAQVTVNCTLFQAPDVVPPDTGTGTIRPPNTGDAGLAAGGPAWQALAAVAGATLLALAVAARRGLAR